MGKIFIQFAAIFDEYYAEDISQRAKDSVRYRSPGACPSDTRLSVRYAMSRGT
jgi:hypothetical protein